MTCPRCHRPRATSALWDHPDGCECAECAASCFDECMGGKGREIHIQAPVTAGHQCPRCGGLGTMPDGSVSMGPAGVTYRPGTECATCGGKGRVHVTAALPAAGSWVRVEDGCEMPESGATILIWSGDTPFGPDVQVMTFGENASAAEVRGMLLMGLVGDVAEFWSPLHAPEEERK